MLAIFPSLQPEELVCSAVSRYADMMAFPDVQEALLRTFHYRPGDPDPELPEGLQYLLDILPPGHGLTCRSLTEAHTALPFYRPFLDPRNALLVEDAMQVTSLGRSSPYGSTGLPDAQKRAVTRPSMLRFCKRCVEADRQNPSGIVYWRRVHQLLGVVVCPTHHVPLTYSAVPRDPREYGIYWREIAPVFVSLERALSLSSQDIEVHPAEMGVAQAVAEDSQWLLNHTIPPMGVSGLIRRHRGWMARRGFIRPNGRIDEPRFREAIEQAYPDDVISSLGCTPTWLSRYRLGFNWLRSIWRRPHPVLPPHSHILLWRLLGLSAEQFFTEESPPLPPSGRATLAGPCGNPVCGRYDPPVPRAIPRRRGRGAPYASVDCPECGFAYGQRTAAPGGRRAILRVGPLWENRLRELAAEGGKLRDVARALGVHPGRVKHHAVVLGCWASTWGPMPEASGPGKRAQARTRRITAYRRKVRHLHKYQPKLTRRWLEQELPKEARYLARVDQAWLDAEVPPDPPRERPRRWRRFWVHPSPDDCALRESRALVALLRAWPGQPFQIRPRSVLRLVGWYAIANFDFIPQTRAYLAEVAESAHAFAERRIVWAARWCATYGETPSLEQLADAAMLSVRRRRIHRGSLQHALGALQAHAGAASRCPRSGLPRSRSCSWAGGTSGGLVVR